MHLPEGWGDPTLWVLICVLAFLGLLVFLKVPQMIAGALDKRAGQIKDELDEARRLREEAQELLASYQRKQKEAEDEAEAIVAQARKDAERMAKDARAQLAEQLERRAQMAENKIASAEAAALTQVKGAAAEMAVKIAEKVIAEDLKAADHNTMVKDGISALKGQLQ